MAEGKKKVSKKSTAEKGVKLNKPDKDEAKKKVKKVEDGPVNITHSKAKPEADRVAYTGTRFRKGTSQQIVYDIVRTGAKNGTSVEAIKAELSDYRKDKGKDRNLDSGYFPFVVATHPEDFAVVRKDGKLIVKLLQDVQPNKEAIVEAEAKKAKSKAAKAALVAKGKDKPKSGKSSKSEGKGKPKKKSKPAKPAK